MRSRILIALALVISSLLVDVLNSYAAEARASATILIIIPPREEEVEKKVVEMSSKEEKDSLEREAISVKDDRED